ncbi:thioredoxin family protein [Celeribacter indicus]|uniref:Alkyl hydroperoxide reductase/ thiol specific antioxidant/ Mal allergen n=1 Tax=Celeribacter indicus TaxID=1208324 RepID=A0A0B5E1E7_9RHOB|nr:thioredoxin family protein [Celeribacter indicus]AJE46831.1 alkyl hydroperoxide reductase/ thiol specific antioxidant/ Mal allergen [Celeribacter indicus]SDW80827.1 Peroxiredoxin [Celeribacter indicus]
MPKTESRPVELGTVAPEFRLPDASGRLHALSDYAQSPALLVAFISNRCPYVLGIREAFAAFARANAPRGLQVIAINSNDPEHYPEEALDRLGQEAEAVGYGFPYLKDYDQEVARAYDAACTPDFFLFDAGRRLAYHGQFDGFRPGNDVPVTGSDLQAAVDAVLSGAAPTARQIPSIGCNIKWRETAHPATVAAAE